MNNNFIALHTQHKTSGSPGGTMIVFNVNSIIYAKPGKIIMKEQYSDEIVENIDKMYNILSSYGFIRVNESNGETLIINPQYIDAVDRYNQMTNTNKSLSAIYICNKVFYSTESPESIYKKLINSSKK